MYVLLEILLLSEFDFLKAGIVFSGQSVWAVLNPIFSAL
jgi:hypothetical protein